MSENERLQRVLSYLGQMTQVSQRKKNGIALTDQD